MYTHKMMPLSLLLLAILAIVNSAFSQAPAIVSINGNALEMSAKANDTIYVQDPVTGNKLTRVTKPKPLNLNGEKIYTASELTSAPKYTGDEGHYHTLIFNKLQKELNKLNDGIYYFSIDNMVINKEGKLVYFTFGGLHKAATFNNKAASANVGFSNYAFVDNDIINDTEGEEKNPVELTDLINKRVKPLLDNFPKLQPAQLNGEPVNYACKMFNADNTIQVRNHVATFSPTENAL